MAALLAPLRSGDDSDLNIIVGYAVKAPSKPIETPPSLFNDVDAALERDAESIARNQGNAKSVPIPPKEWVLI